MLLIVWNHGIIPSMYSKNQWLILLAAVSLLATSLMRFQALDRMLIWHDEVFSIARVFGYQQKELVDAVHDGKIHTPSELLRFQKPRQGAGFEETLRALEGHPEHGPLFYLLGWAFSSVASTPIVALRGISVVLSLLMFPAIFWLSRELSYQRYAWVALTLAATSPLYFLYAREARQYALWLVLITAASASLLRVLRYNKAKEYLIYVALLTLALYTHLMTGLIILAHALFVACLVYRQRDDWKERGKRLTLAWGGVLLLFIPWLSVILEQRENFRQFTGWMSQAASMSALVQAWQLHVVLLFIDLPGIDRYWIAGGVLSLILMIQYFRHAPNQPRLLLGMLVLTCFSFVVLPDLLLGGRRSLETRYLLPLLLAMELMFAWVLSSGLSSKASRLRVMSHVGLIIVMGAGLFSQYVITQSDSWWTKSLSAENARFARLVNAARKPLVMGSFSAISTGEILSLAHLLDDHVNVLMEDQNAPLGIPDGYSQLFVLLPSERLRGLLETRYEVTPFPGSWKWFIASPRN